MIYYVNTVSTTTLVLSAHIPLLRKSLIINLQYPNVSPRSYLTGVFFKTRYTYIFPVVANVCSYWRTSVGTPKLPTERNVLAALNGTPQRLIPYQIRVVKRSVDHCVVFT